MSEFSDQIEGGIDMNNRVRRTFWMTSAVLILAMSMDECWARDFASAGNTYVSTLKTIAQILAPAGIISGGIIQQIAGAEDFGNRVLKGGLIGCLCAFGGPAFVGLMRSVFGSI